MALYIAWQISLRTNALRTYNTVFDQHRQLREQSLYPLKTPEWGHITAFMLISILIMSSLCADSSHSNQSEPALETVQKSVLSIYLSTPELYCLMHLEADDLKYCISYIPGNYFFFYMTIYPHLGIFNLLRASVKVIEVVRLSQMSRH